MDTEQRGRVRTRQGVDRRRGVGDVVNDLVGRWLAAPQADLRACFEQAVASTLGFEAVELSAGAGGRADVAAPRVPGAWRHEVPGGAAVLACRLGGGGPDAWDAAQGRALASVAALVVELDRLRGASPRGRHRRPPAVLVGASSAMARVRARVAQVARTAFPVLVLGESGVGKEVVARLVHEQSRRARGPFVAVNCAAIVDTLVEAELFGIEDRTATGVRGRRGKFEQADGGTLFLDEVGDLAASAQAKLLRVLQDLTVERVGGHTATPVDVRVIAATNRDLPALVREGRFRADLYYRLNGVEIEVPPLRSRPEDLPALIAHVLGRHDALGVVRVSDDALMSMRDYAWPGNVRELERVVERALALCDGGCITVDHLPPSISGTYGSVMGPALRDAVSLRAFTARYVRFTVDRLGSRREACRVLGISYHTLRAYLEHPAAGWPVDGVPRPALDDVLRTATLVADRPANGFEAEPSGEGSVP